MSTFPGIITEIDYVSIDRFETPNLKCHAFFLSHCHQDHMRGLNTMEFRAALEQNDAYLYCSKVTCTILKQMYPVLENRLMPLALGTSHLAIPRLGKEMCVTLLPAGHCPGSVMFFFETDMGKVVLYTGDFRVRLSDFKKFSHLFDCTGQIKTIDNVYLDTTFFNEDYLYFPPRSDSSLELCKLCKLWLDSDPSNVVHILTPAKYAYEYLFEELQKYCQMPIHVSAEKFQLYKHFPCMDQVVTLNPKKTRIHNYCAGSGKFCYNPRFGTTLKLKPSAWMWKNTDPTQQISKNTGYDQIGVCYSTHCSYQELSDVIKLLKPKILTPCVVPVKDEERLKMERLLELIANEVKPCETYSEPIEPEWLRIRDEPVEEICEESNEYAEDLFHIMDSPRTKRHKFG